MASDVVIVQGEDFSLHQWLLRQLDAPPGSFGDPAKSRELGFERNGKLIAVIAYFDYRSPSIEMAIAQTEPGWATRKTLRHIFSYPFRILHCRRVTAHTTAKNQTARSFLLRLGFREEGIVRQARNNGEDVIIHGMLLDECKWITDHGLFIRRLPNTSTSTRSGGDCASPSGL